MNAWVVPPAIFALAGDAAPHAHAPAVPACVRAVGVTLFAVPPPEFVIYVITWKAWLKLTPFAVAQGEVSPAAQTRVVSAAGVTTVK